MKKKTLIITGLLIGILLISLASAGLVPWLSNQVSASVSVEGPVFYLDKTNILSGKPDSMYLKMNDDSVSGEWFTLGDDRFYSDNLGVESFYPLDFLMGLRVKASDLPKNETTGEIEESCSIHSIVYRVSDSGGSPDKLCDVITLGINNEGEYEDYGISCDGEYNTEINFNGEDRFELSLSEQCPSNSSMNIKLNGESYIQIKAK